MLIPSSLVELKLLLDCATVHISPSQGTSRFLKMKSRATCLPRRQCDRPSLFRRVVCAGQGFAIYITPMGFSTSVAACFLNSYRKRTKLGAELLVLPPQAEFPFFRRNYRQQAGASAHAFSAQSIPVRLTSAEGLSAGAGQGHDTIFEDYFGYGTYLNVAMEAVKSDFADLAASVVVLTSAVDHCLAPFVSTSVLAGQAPLYARRAEGAGAFYAGEAFVVEPHPTEPDDVDPGHRMRGGGEGGELPRSRRSSQV